MVQSSPSKGGDHSDAVSKWEKESQEATRELLKVKDRLIEVERNVSERCLFEMAQVPFLVVADAFIHVCVSLSLPRMPRCRQRRWL